MIELPIHNMAQRHYGLTPGPAASYEEAARVCLDRHHIPPETFEISGPEQEQTEGVVVKWTKPTRRIKAAWANELDTTRDGAYACVLAAVEVVCGLTAIHRSETETGADYYVAPPGTPPDDIDDYTRIEISGVDRGDTGRVTARLNLKVKQAEKGNSPLPAMAGVVGFRAKTILLANA